MAQMVLAEHHDMAFPADRADQPLSYAFCQGERGDVGRSRMPIDRTRRINVRPIIYHGICQPGRCRRLLLIVGEVFPRERPVGTAQSGGHLEYLDDIAGLTDRLRVRPRKD